MSLLVVRHADAGRRDHYQGDDRERPLSAKGRTQAASLVDMLRDYRPTAILSSPFVRCVETVQPLADALALPVETTDALAEGHQSEALELLAHRSGVSEVFCTHGDVAAAILEALAGRGDPADEGRLQKGEVWVVGEEGTGLVITDRLHQPSTRTGSSRRSPPPVR
jgi:8-oxo-(d)GTP phosphatase